MTLILKGTDNSVSDPAVQGGTAGATTGVYYPASNQVALATNGTLALLVNSSQRIGIGTNNPGAKLEVSGTGNIIRLGDGTNTFDVRFQGPNNWAQQLNTSTDVFSIQRNSVDFFSVNPSGVAVLKNAVTTADGVGITFPATQSASSNANTLDDYEEGTWTPTLAGSSSSPTGVTYPTQVGRYTKVGNVVTIFYYMVWTTYTGGSGDLQVAGMPFSAINDTSGYDNGSGQLSYITIPAGYSYITPRTLPNNTLFNIQINGSNNAWSTLTFSEFSSSGTSKEVIGQITYFANN